MSLELAAEGNQTKLNQRERKTLDFQTKISLFLSPLFLSLLLERNIYSSAKREISAAIVSLPII